MDSLTSDIIEEITQYFDMYLESYHWYSYGGIDLHLTDAYGYRKTIYIDEKYIDHVDDTFDLIEWVEDYQAKCKEERENKKEEQEKIDRSQQIKSAIKLLESEGYKIILPQKNSEIPRHEYFGQFPC